MTHEDAILIISALNGIRASLSTIAFFFFIFSIFKKMNSGSEIDKLRDTIEKLIDRIERR